MEWLKRLKTPNVDEDVEQLIFIENVKWYSHFQ